MQALHAEYPDITILLTMGYVYAYSHLTRPGDTLEKSACGLLPSFLDGLLEGAGPQTLIFDGFEYAYGYKVEKPFQEARQIMRRRGLEWSGVPEQFRQRYRASFGLWLDYGRTWAPQDFTKNYFTPEEFEYSLHLALKYTDRYVWIYSEASRPWGWETEKNVPPPYLAALTRARRPHPHPPAVSRRGPFGENNEPPERLSARTYEGADDPSTFGDLWDRYEDLLSLPRQGWKFKLDPQDQGDRQRWFVPEVKDSDWAEIEIGEWWEPQGYYGYDGAAWYRQWIDIPATVAGRKLLLIFGAVDESARLYLNGHYVGEHDDGRFGRAERFSFDVTRFLQPGQKNLMVVEVYDRLHYGGIWKSVKLVAPR
jgi:hypothetical protein